MGWICAVASYSPVSSRPTNIRVAISPIACHSSAVEVSVRSS